MGQDGETRRRQQRVFVLVGALKNRGSRIEELTASSARKEGSDSNHVGQFILSFSSLFRLVVVVSECMKQLLSFYVNDRTSRELRQHIREKKKKEDKAV